ncbi:EamA family transporter RarD [Campylobacter sp. 19-13652]|uniref:EamA family transporter RarD n=1 Tax=Campylobacter sp. 19-13652 TaxID=2840180 RepID=UPI001C7672D1|nr:EamA family transporter RarD [Campylobacter sp. 19-13652]BCX78760.1 putative transporter [Campylobacter sp. 19-13652]
MTNSEKQGLSLALFAFITWGFVVIFYKFMTHISPYEIIAHRVIWSFLFLFILLILFRRFDAVINILKTPQIRYLLLFSGLLIVSSWCVFVYAINSSNIVEAALGNFSAPIFQMVGGFLFFGERLSRAGKIAFALVVAAVAVQFIELGSLPFVSVFIAISVAAYALVRKKVGVGAYEGLFTETMFTLPLAIVYIMIMPSHFGMNLDGLMLSLNGVVTVVPLLAFTAATVRVRMSTLSLLQYITPTIALFIAVLLYGEPLPMYKVVSFSLIWLAIFIVSVDSVAKNSSKRQLDKFNKI